MRRRRKGCKAWTQLKLQVLRSDPEFVTTTAGRTFRFLRPNVDEAQVARITSFALEALSKSINASGLISAESCPMGDSPRERFFSKIQGKTSGVKTVRWRLACLLSSCGLGVTAEVGDKVIDRI